MLSRRTLSNGSSGSTGFVGVETVLQFVALPVRALAFRTAVEDTRTAGASLRRGLATVRIRTNVRRSVVIDRRR